MSTRAIRRQNHCRNPQCNGLVDPKFNWHKECLDAYRVSVPYRARTLARDGAHCAACPEWWNRAALYLRAAPKGVPAGPCPSCRRVHAGITRIPRTVEADHITCLAATGTHDPRNMQMLCLRHHHKKTRTDVAKLKGRRPPRPWRRRAALAVFALVVFLSWFIPSYGLNLPTPEDGLAWVMAHPRRIGSWALLLTAIYLPLRWRHRSRKAAMERLHAALSKVTGASDTMRRRYRVREWGWRRVTGVKLAFGLPLYRWVPVEFTIRLPGNFDHTDDKHLAVVRTASEYAGVKYRATWLPAADRVVLAELPTMPELVNAGPHMGAAYMLRIGVAETVDAYWNTKQAPHGLIVGPTGSGKTATIRAIVADALAAGWLVTLCDPKRFELRMFRGREGVTGVHTTIPDIEAAITAYLAEVEERNTQIENGVSPSTFRPRLLVVDEVAHLVAAARAAMRQARPPRTGDPAVMEELPMIARLARTANMHILEGIQRPDAVYLTGEARDNFLFRVACGPMGPEGSRMIFGDSWSAREVEDLPGRVLVQVNRGVPERVQVAFIPDGMDPAASDEERAEMERHLPPMVEGSEEAVIAAMEESLVEDDGPAAEVARAVARVDECRVAYGAALAHVEAAEGQPIAQRNRRQKAYRVRDKLTQARWDAMQLIRATYPDMPELDVETAVGEPV